jgi:apolipoprotein N-acyltransferase
LKKAIPVILSVLSGLLLSAAWPARGFPAWVWVAWVPLLYATESIHESKLRLGAVRVWALSYTTFFIWNLLTTWWVYNSSPEGGYIAVIFNSLFMSWAYYLAYLTRLRLGNKKGDWALILFWVSFEYLHMNWDLSWPWLNLGNAFAAFPEWVQWYSYTGVLGGSVWVIASNIMVYGAIRHRTVSRWIKAVFAIGIPLIISYSMYFSYEEKGTPLNITVVQPNIDPWNEKFENGTRRTQYFKMMSLAKEKTGAETDYLVFPETALPESFWNFETDSLPEIQNMRKFLSAFPKTKIIIGVSYLELLDETDPSRVPVSASRYGNSGLFYEDYNSAIQIDTSAQVPVYHKSKLVPGPESFPFARYLEPFQKQLFGNLGGMIGNLGTQKERSVFYAHDNPEQSVGTIICYESVYGEFVTEYVRKGAGMLFIITNDGWWGNTPGHRQHFQYARLRAIETRRCIARSANTGISGFINQRGDVLQQTPYWQDAVISGKLLYDTTITFYVQYGDFLGRLSLFMSVFLLLYVFVKDFLKKKRL